MGNRCVSLCWHLQRTLFHSDKRLAQGGLIFQINACISALSRCDPVLTINNAGTLRAHEATIMTYLTGEEG